MKVILRQTGWLILFFFGCYFSVYALKALMLPDGEYVDVWTQSRTVNDFFRSLTLDSCRLQRSNTPKLIIYGASNTAMGFRPEHLQPHFPEYEVANLSVPGSGVVDMRQAVEMTQTLLPREARRESVYVVGLWYYSLSMAPKKRNNVNKLLVNSGLYRRDGDTVAPIVHAGNMDLLVRILRPFFFLQRHWQHLEFDKSIGKIRRGLDRIAFRKRKEPPDPNKVVYGWGGKPYSDPLTEEQKKDVLRRFGEVFPFEPGVQELLRMCRSVQDRGGKLVLLDMPLAEWHKRRSPAFHIYQQQKRAFFEKALKYPNVRYIDFLGNAELADETLFVDSIHPRKKTTELWCRALKERLSPDTRKD